MPLSAASKSAYGGGRIGAARRKRAVLTLPAGAINLYDRRNVFNVDIFTLERQNHLGFVPSLGR